MTLQIYQDVVCLTHTYRTALGVSAEEVSVLNTVLAVQVWPENLYLKHISQMSETP